MHEDFWKNFPTIPDFDCLKMKQDIQAAIYDEVKDLSPAELVAYFNRAGSDFRRRGRIVARQARPLPVQEKPGGYDPKPPSKD